MRPDRVRRRLAVRAVRKVAARGRGHGALTLGLACAAATLFLPGLAHAGAWTRDQNEFMLQLGYSYGRATGSYRIDGAPYDWANPIDPMTGKPAGNKLPGARQIEQAMAFYGEYGVVDSFTLIVGWEAKFLNIDLGPMSAVAPASASGIPEVRLGGRGRIIKEPLVVSLEVIVGIPAQQKPIDPSMYDPQLTAALGLGTVNASAWLHLGKSFDEFFSADVLRWFSLYANVALGFQYRNNFQNDFVFNLELGSFVWQMFYVGVRYFGDKNVGEPRMILSAIGGGETVPIGVAEQQRIAGALGVRFLKHYFVVADYSTALAGKNSVAFQRATVSVAATF